MEIYYRLALFLITCSLSSSLSTSYNCTKSKCKHKSFKRQTEDRENYVTDDGNRIEVSAGPWSAWGPSSPCSRSCGGGVSVQERYCAVGNACRGPKKKYFSCNIQPCADNDDFRAQQCAEYNQIPYEGIYYNWVPYTKSPNKCELNCMPRGERFYYRHKLKVIDGTKCEEDKPDVCVDGRCQPVGCDNILGSPLREDNCRVCGGDGSTCNRVEGLLDSQDYIAGYNDILLIPARATNVIVRERAPSNNYLAIRNITGHYYLNGNWRIEFPKRLYFAGTVWDYDRTPQGFSAPNKISCSGPIREAIYIVLLRQDVNVGVEYEYSVPKDVHHSGDLDSYAWVPDDFSPCSTTCGGGYQTRTVHCVSTRTQDPVDENLCDAQARPSESAQCATETPCEPRWQASAWSECSAVCGNTGTRIRQINCERVINNGHASIVDDAQCEEALGPKPETREECNRKVECPKWFVGAWKPCDHLCGRGKQTREVKCYRKNEKNKIETLDDRVCVENLGEPRPESEQRCELRPCEGLDWITSEWSGCEDKCGASFETRTAFCATQKGKVYPNELCHQDHLPELQRECTASSGCEFQWFTSQWSKCSAKCGSGVQTRKVFCGYFDDDDTIKKAPEDKCDLDEKEDDKKNCTGPVKECPGEWFTGPWTKCNKPCGGGEMTRKVVCLANNVTVNADKCDPEQILFASETCNTFPCGADEALPVEVTNNVPTEDYDMETEATEATTDDDCDEYVEEDDEEETESTDISQFTEELTDQTESGTEDSTSASTLLASEDLMFSDSTVSDYTDSDSTGEEQLSSDITSLTSESGSGDGEDETSETTPLMETTLDSTDLSSTEGDTTTGYSTASDETLPSEASSESPSTTDSSTSESTEFSESTIVTSESSPESSTVLSSSSSSESSTESSTQSSSESSSENSSSSEPSTTESSETSDTSSESSPPTETTEVTSESSPSSEITTESSPSSTESESTTMESSSSTLESSSSTSDSSETTSESSTMSSGFSMTDSSDVTESSLYTSTSLSSTDASESTESSSLSSEETKETSEVSESSSFSTEPTESTSESSTFSSESTVTGESSSTESSGSTESSIGTSTEFSTSSESTYSTDTSISTETSETSESTSESTQSTESSSETSTEDTSDAFPFSTRKWKICKVPKKKKTPKCAKSEFGCCPDQRTEAQGPFDKGCKLPKTCNETEFGCCPDGVSPADGPKDKGCPKIKCKDTLFGCCPDKVTAAKGNDHEGCVILPKCTKTKFGCCPDNKTEAKGKNHKGCKPDVAKTAGKPKEENCTTTAHGCCPSGTKPASGPNYDGCEEINKKNCKESFFGCCPDGVTAALDKQYAGCKFECDESTFGCCPDRKTPAHGPYGEGCCIPTRYGCCPDDTTPARGPNNEGCECQYTTFGCCPDNSTLALGPNQEGCSCKHTEHGCCPDGIARAQGPDYYGCPCYAFQFGCCDDGETPASGPRNQGCGCQNSKFGCCSDGKTAAKDENMGGCDCSTSKYGCCPDGVAEAKGEQFEGCENVPKTALDICTQEKEKGECRNYTVKWFFDVQYGGCSRFWYGGCGANDNNFRSQDECKSVCVEPEGKAVCSLPKVPGPCESYIPTWYYDTTKKQCSQFIYGGCLGNQNRFQSFEDCRAVCGASSGVDACEQSAEQGPCNGRFTRWYFNKETNQCDRFNYGGCQANENNFLSENACHQKCMQTGKQKDFCALPNEPGNCTENEARWYFNGQDNRCRPFYYNGCNGNENQFVSRDSCQSFCPSKVERDICVLPAVTGECADYSERWYYDTKDKRCRQFYYGGCGGNENNFNSEAQCNSRCNSTQEETTPPPVQPRYPESQPRPQEPQPFDTSSCSLQYDQGPCRNGTARWYYDRSDGVCKQFLYGGCDGNANNFLTREECVGNCGHIQDLCTLPKTPGTCSGNETMWYYDATYGTCEPFQYSGCLGNDNRFVDQASCEERCRQRAPGYTVQTRPPPVEAQPVDSSPRLIDYCYYPQDAGSCNDTIPAYYYNRESQRCEDFYYSGCDGNANRFESIEQCERYCGEYVGQDVCNLDAETGVCRGLFQKYYYDRFLRQCKIFIYGGCGGNGNRFSSIEECETTCASDEEANPENNEILTTVPPSPERCEEANEKCRTLRCPFGVEKSVNNDNCEQCECFHPCRDVVCENGEVCAIDYERSESGELLHRPVCRLVNKPGACPQNLQNNSRCEHECYSDAQCPNELKCCADNCNGAVCVAPERDYVDVELPSEPPRAYEAEPIEFDETPQDVRAEEGSYATLQCIARGRPPPRTHWRKGSKVIEHSEARYRLLADGSLQVVGLYKQDAGIYLCVADNGVTLGQREVRLEVTSPESHQANVISNDNSEPERQSYAIIGHPTRLFCYAVGWPRPTVTWWRGEDIISTSTDLYEHGHDYTLLIRNTPVKTLGLYTCQAYNGVGKAASGSVTVLALGSVEGLRPEEDAYRQYIVSNVRETPQPRGNGSVTEQPDVPPAPRVQTPRTYVVPVRASIQLQQTVFPIAGEISIPCDVEGFPIPRVQWYKNNEPIEVGRRVNITESNRLIIADAKVSDSGEYKCEAYNQYSSSASAVTVTVEGSYLHPSCTDNPFFAKCELIVRAKYCQHPYYARFCCRSCTLAGLLPPTGKHLDELIASERRKLHMNLV